MPRRKFSDLSLLWPFANQLDRTFFVYREQEESTLVHPHVPANDSMAIVALSKALGSIAMDDSTPGFYVMDDKREKYREVSKINNIILVGGGIRNEVVGEFLKECDRKQMKRVVALPSTSEALPREMRFAGEVLRTRYWDPECKCVKRDYGLIFLTENPFITEKDPRASALLVAGLHSYGTLAAAKTVSDSYLSAAITRFIISNFHLPPHLLGSIEVIIQANVDRNGNLLQLNPKKNIRHIYVDGQLLPPTSLYGTGNKHTSANYSISRDTENLRVSFDDQRPSSSNIATPMTPITDEKKRSLSMSFFDHFSVRSVIVVSPHSDDSAIACGGLLYYLRNKELWRAHNDKYECPPVDVLVMTESARGAGDYFPDYYSYIGMQNSNIDSFEEEELKEMLAGVRYNESLGEEMTLATNSHWLALENLSDVSGTWEILHNFLQGILDEKRIPLFLLPYHSDQHPTHKSIRKLMLGFIRNWPELRDHFFYENGDPRAEVWTYESPWSALNIEDINVIIPLNKYAMFAKCQAISMHQSQEFRTQFTDIATNRSRYFAEALPELLLSGFASAEKLESEFLEVFSSFDWFRRDFSPD